MLKTIIGSVIALMTIASSASAEGVSADVWADNWFALYVNGQKVAEDPVPITTERSFNAESFSFSTERPFVLAIMAKDFKENDTGLEYIGSRRQQMGDGGLIGQFIGDDGSPVAVTQDAWRCLVVHRAPLDAACEREDNPIAGNGACGFETMAEPAGWTSVDFDDSGWPFATEHSAQSVGPKDGYDRIGWVSDAKIIWGADLERDNTILCRLLVR